MQSRVPTQHFEQARECSRYWSLVKIDVHYYVGFPCCQTQKSFCVPYTRLTANVVDGDTVLFAADVAPSDSEGDHLVSFTPKISGTYGLVLLFDGTRQLSGSPFKVRVKTDETMAANCKLYGPGLTRAVAGERTSFSIKGGDCLSFSSLRQNTSQ